MSAGSSGARPAPGNPAGISKVQEVQLQVDEASNVMRDNVSQMLHNYEKAEVLEDKAGARPPPAGLRGSGALGAKAPRGRRRCLGYVRAASATAEGRAAPSRHEPSPPPLRTARPRDAARAASLTEESKKFYKRSNQVKQNMCMRNAKMWVMIACLVAIVIVIITVPIVVQSMAAAKALEGMEGDAGGE